MQDCTTDNAILFSALGQYGLGNKTALVAGGSYNWLADKGFDHYDNHTLCDELSGIIQIAHHISRYTTLAGGYQFVHGGLPGRLNYHQSADTREFPIFDSNRPEEHSLVFDLHRKFAKGLEGFFWNSRAQHNFRWVEGWWFTNTLGYKYDLNKRSDIIVSATWHASMNYFDAHTANANGTQGYSIQVSAPTMVSENVRITPHAGILFIGNGAKAANRNGANLYRDTTFVLGLNAQYVF